MRNDHSFMRLDSLDASICTWLAMIIYRIQDAAKIWLCPQATGLTGPVFLQICCRSCPSGIRLSISCSALPTSLAWNRGSEPEPCEPSPAWPDVKEAQQEISIRSQKPLSCKSMSILQHLNLEVRRGEKKLVYVYVCMCIFYIYIYVFVCVWKIIDMFDIACVHIFQNSLGSAATACHGRFLLLTGKYLARDVRGFKSM